MMYFKLVVATLAISIAAAAPTHADDQSFQDYLGRNHIGTGPVTSPIALGNFICVQIRGGMSPINATQMTWGPGLDMPGIVDAAQHELCPDTLH